MVGGSGMSANQAQEIIDRMEHGPFGHALPELVKRIKAINEANLDNLVRYGLETRAVVNGWRRRYQDYVPLRGWDVEPDDAPPNYGAGGQFNVRGPEVKQALGRGSKADNPLVNLLEQAYRFIERGERNGYLQSLASALSHLSADKGRDAISDFVTLNKGRSKRVLDPKSGLVVTIDDFADRNRPEAVHFKVKGEPRYMVFHDVRLAEAIKRMNPYGLGPMSWLLTAENKMKSLWTHYSPEFLVRHFLFRYPIEGLLNALELRDTGDFSTIRYLKDAFPIWGAATRAILAVESGRNTGGQLRRSTGTR